MAELWKPDSPRKIQIYIERQSNQIESKFDINELNLILKLDINELNLIFLPTNRIEPSFFIT